MDDLGGRHHHRQGHDPRRHDAISSGDSGERSFASFDHLTGTCRRTRAVLVAIVHERAGDGEAVRGIVAREALAHVDAVLDGLTYLSRARSFTSDELRELVRRAGIEEPPRAGTPEGFAAAAELAAEQEAERQAGFERPGLRPIDGATMLAAGHARVVFSVIPRLPPEAVAWPRAHRTYADIPVPRSETELLMRAEELAQVLWRVAEGDDRRDEPLRRTLAFYEAGSRLSFRGGFVAA